VDAKLCLGAETMDRVREAFSIDTKWRTPSIDLVAQRPLIKGVSATGDTDITGESEKSRNRSVGEKTS